MELFFMYLLVNTFKEARGEGRGRALSEHECASQESAKYESMRRYSQVNRRESTFLENELTGK